MLQKINVNAQNPNQQVNFNANNQNFTLNLYWQGYINLPTIEQDFINTYALPNYYADIYLGGEAIIIGALVIDRTSINQYPSNMNGYIMSVDSIGNDNLTIQTLGISNFMYYLDNLSELSQLEVNIK